MRLPSWWPRVGAARAERLGQQRWIVIDCETSGLDMRADRLLSIGAVSVEQGRIAIGQGFSVTLRQERPSDAANIAVHGIGGDAQLSGTGAVEALAAFETYAADGVRVAFHAAFDRAFLERARREARMPVPDRRWLDLAQLLPALFPALARECRSLDDWLSAYRLADGVARHNALADAYGTAQLLLVALAACERQKITGLPAVLRIAANARWIA